MTSEEAKPSKKQHTKPCSDCPWTRTSLNGWLGSASVGWWIDIAHSETLVDCHTVSNQQCAGITIYRANVCKLTRDPEILRLPADRKTVFASRVEFVDHHSKSPELDKEYDDNDDC